MAGKSTTSHNADLTMDEYKRDPIYNTKRLVDGYKNTNKFQLPKLLYNPLKAVLCLGMKPDTNILPFLAETSSAQTCTFALDAKVDVNSSYIKDGRETAMHCAVRNDSYEKCKLLIDNGIDLTIQWKGLTPLQFGIAFGARSDILQILAEKRPELLTTYGPVGESALNCAIRLGVKPWIESLIVPQTDVLSPDGTGVSPLQLSCKDSDIHRLVSKYATIDDATNAEMRAWTAWYAYEQQCSTKIYTNKGIDHKMSTDDFKEILDRNRMLLAGECEEYEEIKYQVDRLIQTLAQKLEETCLAFKPIYAGSTAEGTKTFMPNEFDIICQFTQSSVPEGQKVKIAENGEPYIAITLADIETTLDEIVENTRVPDEQINAAMNSPWNPCLLPSSTWKTILDRRVLTLPKLHPKKVASHFYDKIEDALDDVIKEVNFGPLQLFRKSLVLKDKISCLRLLWRGETYKDMVIHVDLVPAFALDPGFIGDSEKTNAKEYHLISKVSRHYEKPEQPRFQVSHSRAERSDILDLPDHVKYGLLAAKMFRMRSICCPSDVTSLLLEDDVSSEDFITSYMLKTCLFYLIEESENLEGTMYDWADRIYEKLEKFLNDHKIPLKDARILKQDGTQSHPPLLECNREYEKTPYGCCMRRHLMLQLCHEIRKWLRENKAALESQS